MTAIQTSDKKQTSVSYNYNYNSAPYRIEIFYSGFLTYYLTVRIVIKWICFFEAFKLKGGFYQSAKNKNYNK